MAETNQQALDRIREQQRQTDAEIAREQANADRLEEKVFSGTATSQEQLQYFNASENLESLNRRKTNLYGAEARADDAVLLQGADQPYDSGAAPAYMSGGRIENDFGGTPVPAEPEPEPPVQETPAPDPTPTPTPTPAPAQTQTPAPASEPQATVTDTAADDDIEAAFRAVNGGRTPQGDYYNRRREEILQARAQNDALDAEQTQEYGGGRGSVVEQPNERADALDAEQTQEYGGGRGSVVEQPPTISQLDATENALNSLEALPTQERLKVQPQIDALRKQREELIEEARSEAASPEPVNPAEDPLSEGGDVQDIGESEVVRSAQPVGPQFAENETAFGLGGERGTALRVRENEQIAELDAAEQALADRELKQPPMTQKQREFRERNIAALRGDLEATQEELEELDVPTEEVPIPAEQRLQNQVENTIPENVDPAVNPTVENTAASEDINISNNQQAEQQAAEQEIEREQQVNNAALEKLKAQSVVQQERNIKEGTGDWRVKLRLASGADYFYNSITQSGDDVERTAGILAPLQATDGIIFPYTPSVQILYSADYNQYHPTHSNYQHYFYKGSKVGEIVMTATFTAQDTDEANYLLAVIHFLKSASKMFYGQDQQRGSPPPLLFLTGFGDYQFNEAPCVITQFNYALPNDVDYIRAGDLAIREGTLQNNLRNRNNGSNLTSWSSKINRILTSPGLTPGAENPTSNFSSETAKLSTDDATYVPTKLEMTITLLPVVNRLQVSQGFSLKEYANGSLIKGGFW